ncbi:MAG: ParB N-terminal domain-containing protein [Rikenellaceae bacterium]|nr:ParB N-terminal domain-containing protein [Rikenellaceae bacterium]
MSIKRMKLADIRPYENNAKRHPQSQVDQIAASIQELGYRDLIAVDENGVIIEGHGRFLALQQLGWLEAEVIRLDGLTDEQKRAYILVHNQLTMSTGFDPELLRQEIEAITSIDLAAFDLVIPAELTPEPEPEEPTQAGPELVSFVLTLSEEQYQELQAAVEIIKTTVPTLHSFGNPNKRNNGIFEVVYQWAERKKLL